MLAREWSFGKTLASRQAYLVNKHSTDRPMERIRSQAQSSPTIQSQGMGRGQEYHKGDLMGLTGVQSPRSISLQEKETTN